MNYGNLVVLIFSIAVSMGVFIIRFFAYNGEYEGNEITDILRGIFALFALFDYFKDVTIFYFLLHFLLYGTIM